VLVEAQLAARAQHASQLGQRGGLVWHGAEDQTRHRGIKRAILGRQTVSNAVKDLDWNGCARRLGASPSP
jgi:hypothetical protein